MKGKFLELQVVFFNFKTFLPNVILFWKWLGSSYKKTFPFALRELLSKNMLCWIFNKEVSVWKGTVSQLEICSEYFFWNYISQYNVKIFWYVFWNFWFEVFLYDIISFTKLYIMLFVCHFRAISNVI